MPTTYVSATDLAAALRQDAVAHRHQGEFGHPGRDWPAWDEQSRLSGQAGTGAGR